VFRQLVQLIGGTAQAEQLAAIYSCLGEVEQALGKLDKAKKRFNKALELQANNIDALKGIASVLDAQGEWNTLLNVFNNIIYYAQTREDVIEAYLTKGRVLDVQLKLPAKAAQHYRKALAFGPNQPRALLRLAELSLRSEDWAEAGQLAARALGGPIEPGFRGQFLLVQAICHQSLGDGAAADVDLKAAIEGDSSLAEELGEIDASAVDDLRAVVRRHACDEPS
jgi:tetratricopeptide (TPR) repeat protein